MHVDAEVVRGAVHEVFFIEWLFRVLIGNRLRIDQAEADQFVIHQLADFFLILADENAGLEHGAAGAEDAQDGVIDVPLALGETPIHGDAAGEVGVVMSVFGGDVEEKHLPVLAAAVVGDVVQDAGVWPTGDDRGVSEAAGALAEEFVGEFSFDFELVDAGADEVQETQKTIFGDAAGFLDEGEFMRALDAAQGIQNGGETLNAVQRIFLADAAGEAQFPRFHGDDGAWVFVAIEKDNAGLAHELAEEGFEFAGPDDLLNAGALTGLGLGEFVTLPDGDEFGGLPHEQDLPLFWVRRVRKEKQHGLFLVDAGEVVEIAVWSIAEGAIGIGRHDVIGVDNDERTRW